MNRLTLRTQLQVTGFGNTTAEQTSQDEWLRAAYEWVWAQTDWSFKKIDDDSVSVTAGDSTPTPPTYFGMFRHLTNENGVLIPRLDEKDFDEQYRPGALESQRGTPEACKVVNRVITLGPVPSASATFYLAHDAKVFHLASDGSTRDGGYLDADTDIPAWGYPDGDHHMILVYHAGMVAHALRSNPAAVTMQDLRDDALEAMLEEYHRDTAGNTEYGRQEE